MRQQMFHLLNCPFFYNVMFYRGINLGAGKDALITPVAVRADHRFQGETGALGSAF
jgi:hypothetical protein